MTTAEAAEFARVDVDTILYWADHGKFTAWNITKEDAPSRRILRIDRQSLEDFLESRMVTPVTERPKPKSRKGRSLLPAGMMRLAG